MGLIGSGLSLIGGLLGNAGTTAGLLAMQKSSLDLKNATLSTSSQNMALLAHLQVLTMAKAAAGSVEVAKANITQTQLSAQAYWNKALKTAAKDNMDVVNA